MTCTNPAVTEVFTTLSSTHNVQTSCYQNSIYSGKCRKSQTEVELSKQKKRQTGYDKNVTFNIVD